MGSRRHMELEACILEVEIDGALGQADNIGDLRRRLAARDPGGGRA
jgi:hypothetical protein